MGKIEKKDLKPKYLDLVKPKSKSNQEIYHDFQNILKKVNELKPIKIQPTGFIQSYKIKQQKENIFHEIINIKLKPGQDLGQLIKYILDNSKFQRNKFRINAGFNYLKSNGEKIYNWSSSNWYYNHETFKYNEWENQIENEQLAGSGFSKERFISDIEIIMEVYKIKDIKASSWVELPEKYKNSKSIINIQNKDQFCFVWCILAHLHPAKDHKYRPSMYKPYFNNLNLKDLEFPMPISQIPKFENQNKLSINVFELENNTLSPIYVNKNYKSQQIDLLLYQNHYCLITKLHTLISDNHHLKCICRRCLNTFGSEKVLNDHIEMCQNLEPCKIEFPKDDYLYFKDYYTKIDIPIRVYADFECFNIPRKEYITQNTKILSNQEPCSIVYYLISPWQTGYKYSTQKDCANIFVHEIFEIEKKAREYFDTSIDLKMTPQNEIDFNNSDICWLCDKKCDKNEKVRDHDHLTGKFRGPAHKSCNLNAKQNKSSFVPVLFHNFSGYDCHLIFEHLINKAIEIGFQKHHIKIIPRTVENFISLQIGCLRFLDSYRFLGSSLDSLAKSLNDFPIMRQQQFDDPLLINKLAYPYEYFNPTNFDSKLHLKRKDFWSTLKQNYPKQNEIDRTFEIIKKYNLKSGRELTLMYNLLDVLLLADIFENFIKKCLEYYKINPLYSYSAPGFTWKAFFKFSNTRIDYIKDHKLLLVLENNIRGGISGVMGDRYVKSDDSTKILYIDANNLYGWAMSQFLPIGNFQEIEIKDNQINLLNCIINTPDNSDVGYFLLLDLEYPAEIKLQTENFPLCPYKTKADPDHFSDYMNSNKQSDYRPVEKLVCDQTNKYNYFVHYRLLKFYIGQGMKVIKVHSVWKFNQAPIIRQYIEFNTNQRKIAKTEFEKNLFKLLNNSLYGKFIENVRNHVNVDPIAKSDYESIIKRQSKLSFDGLLQSYNTFNVYKFKKSKITFKKPIYLGFSILELSKLLMYQFYYDKLKMYFNNNIMLCYMDTDSFVLKIKTNDIEKDLEHFKQHFDFSDMPKEHKLYSSENKKVIGKFKIETSPYLVIDEFCCLRSKSYTFSCNDKIVSKQKGVQKLDSLEEYKNCLFNNQTTNQTNYLIRSNNHSIKVIEQNKLALNSFDDKRLYINNTQSVPWDIHIQKYECSCILCMKFIGLYGKELTHNKTDLEVYYNIKYWKEFYTQNQLIQAINLKLEENNI